MSRRKDLKRLLGGRYFYERSLGDKEIERLRKEPPADFTEAVTATLTAGCLRLTAVLYRAASELLLGYDVFVKDDPESPEWICYDSLEDSVSLKETDMLCILDRLVSERGLSYTESCFATLDGKTISANKRCK